MQTSESAQHRKADSPGTLRAALVRALYGIGKIIAIKLPSLPSGYSLITAHDLLERNALSVGNATMPLFADSHVAYIGEPAGIIAGPDPLIVEELAVSAVVECENDSSVTHDWKTQLEVFDDARIASRYDAMLGNFESIREDGNFMEFSSTVCIEPHPLSSDPFMEALAEWDYDKLRIEVPTLWPDHVRSSIASLMKASPKDIELVPQILPSSSELFFWYPSLLAAQAASAARVLKRPVRLSISPTREMAYLPRAHGSIIHLTTRWGPKGLRGLWCRFVIDAGAYPVFGDSLLKKAVQNLLFMLNVDNINICGFSVTTPTPPSGAIEGLSSAALHSAFQAQVSKAARASGKNLSEMMPQLLARRGTSRINAERPDTIAPELYFFKAVDPVIKTTDYARRHASYELIRKRNLGSADPVLKCISLAFACQNSIIHSFFAKDMKPEISLALERNLKAFLYSDLAASGDRLKTAIAALIAKDLKIPSSHVVILHPEEVHGIQFPFSGSSGIAIMSEMIRRATDRIQRLRFRESLPLSTKAYARIKSSSRFDPSRTKCERQSIGAAVVQADYDVRTGTFLSLQIQMNVYAGRILSRSGTVTALREATFQALEACLGARDDRLACLHSLPLSNTNIGITITDDANARTVRPVGFLPWLLILSCILDIIDQIEDSGRIELPHRPRSPQKEGT